jgi:hypothetical protein
MAGHGWLYPYDCRMLYYYHEYLRGVIPAELHPSTLDYFDGSLNQSEYVTSHTTSSAITGKAAIASYSLRK